MPSAELERLVEAGLIKREEPILEEYRGLVASGETRLDDVRRADLSLDGRFDLAYNAAHALALAALRRQGYRAAKRFVVFQALAHTLDVPAARWRLLAKCHDARNRIEYEGLPSVTERLVEDLVDTAGDLLVRLRALPPLEGSG